MNIGNKLKKLRQDNHLSQVQVAKKLGISQGTYATWESKTTNATLDLLEKVAKIYDISLYDVIDEEIQPQDIIELINNYKILHQAQKETIVDLTKLMVEKNAKFAEVREKSLVCEMQTYLRSDLYEVEVQDERLSAGFGTGVTDNHESYTVYTDTPVRRYDSAARIKGESMEPDIPNASIVTFVDNGFDVNGDIYVISEGGYGEETLYCKQVFCDEDGFRCHSLNPDPQYKDFYLGEDSRILGAVIDSFEEIDPSLIYD